MNSRKRRDDDALGGSAASRSDQAVTHYATYPHPTAYPAGSSSCGRPARWSRIPTR